MATDIALKNDNAGISVSDRKNLLKQMNTKLQEEVLEIEHEIEADAQYLLEKRWHLAGRLININENPEIYGKNSSEMLEKYFDASRAMLACAIRFRKAYPTEEKLNAFLGIRTKNNLPLTWTHASQLARLKDPSERKEAEKAAVKGNMTEDELRHYVDAKLGKKTHGSKKGRPPKPLPSQLPAFSARMYADLVAFSNKLNQWTDPDSGLVRISETTPPDEFDKHTLDELEHCARSFDSIVACGQTMVRELDKIVDQNRTNKAKAVIQQEPEDIEEEDEDQLEEVEV